MTKHPAVTSVATALKQHAKFVTAAEAEQRQLQLKLYKCVEDEIKSRFPGGHFDISGTFEGGSSVLRKDFVEEVAKTYKEAGWDATFTNADGTNTRVSTPNIRFKLKPKKGKGKKK